MTAVIIKFPTPNRKIPTNDSTDYVLIWVWYPGLWFPVLKFVYL